MLIKCDSRLLDIFDRANLYDLKNNMDKSNIFTLAIIIQNLQWFILSFIQTFFLWEPTVYQIAFWLLENQKETKLIIPAFIGESL